MDGSIVEYVSTDELPTTKCGYCKKPDTSYTQGVWGYKMTCYDFQTLVDRGFQRSGNYVYRPEMKKTCCPQYVIRMDVRKFRLSKSQKSSIKKFKRYLVEGLPEKETNNSPNSTAEGASSQSSEPLQSTCQSVKTKPKKIVRPGDGPDPDKPPCKKAKILRREKRAKKISSQNTGTASEASNSKSEVAMLAPMKDESQDSGLSQELKELLTFQNKDGNAHTFKARLLPAKFNNEAFSSSKDASFQIFHKFQTGVHQEAEEDAQMRQFKDFLLDSPLILEKHSDCISFGTFHYQYLIDDKIFAVGVLDILPKGVVCEYLYYDPYFRFIAPGVITALLEISLSQQYYLQNNAMKYYYMGFYVQSCPKMNYKRRYGASALLCTETYTYVDLEKCIPLLEASPYARLADPEVEDANDSCSNEELDEVVLLTQSAGIMKYGMYKQLTGVEVDEVIRGYVKLVGKEMSTTMKAHISATEIGLSEDLEDDMSP